ncbi:DUF1043 family protein, partial [Aquisalimonas sp.]|uniref:ZapG family protein n=1 Tax=Aquisalimonas sp. TaxID=1872621 RepID=UPI0025BDBE05
MTTVVWIIVVLICFGLGIWLGRYTAPGLERAREVEHERDEAQAELQRYREDVRTHFEKTANLFNSVTGAYRELYEHLADGSGRLGTGENAPMLESKPEDRTLQMPLEGDKGPEGETAPASSGVGATKPAAKPERETAKLAAGEPKPREHSASADRAGAQAEAPAKSGQAPAKGAETPAKGAEGPAKGTQPPPKGTEPPPKGAEGPAKGTEPPPKGAEAPTKGAEAPTKGAETPAKGT